MDIYAVLEFLKDASPLLVSTLVLAIVILYALRALKPIIESLQSFLKDYNNQQKALNASWQALVDDQNHVNDLLRGNLERKLDSEIQAREGLQARIAQLEKDLKLKDDRISELVKEIAELKKQKDREIAELQSELDTLRLSDEEKTRKIDELTKELAKVVAERNDMKARLDAMEEQAKKAQAAPPEKAEGDKLDDKDTKT